MPPSNSATPSRKTARRRSGHARRRLRARKKKQVRDAILAVCGRLFRTRGFDETTVDDIVGEIEISRQTFFNYFPGKEAVLAELGLAWLGAQGERARAGARSDRPARLMAGFRRVLREQLAAVEQDREFMRLVFTRSGLFFPHGPHVGSRADEPRLDRTRAFFAGLASLIGAAQEAGELRATSRRSDRRDARRRRSSRSASG
jgi:AcrR family transcriptional regulator